MPKAVNWQDLIRPNILTLEAYTCARDLFPDDGKRILVDANENALGHSILDDAELDALKLNRYPDPAQMDIKGKLATLRNFKAGAQGVFLGVGSDEVLDLLMRITCVPGKDTIMG